MDVLVGLLLGAGVGCLWWSCWAPTAASRAVAGRGMAVRPAERLRDLLARAGTPDVEPRAVLTACLCCGGVTLVVVSAVSRTPTIAVLLSVAAAWGPLGVVRRRAARRRARLRELWPDVVDNLCSGVRAGLSLAEALSRLGDRGPEPLRPAFRAFEGDLHASGRFVDALDALKDRLADPVGDRLCEVLRIAREVGGSDLGRLLRGLSASLREDARARGELEARQTWNVNAARVAVSAPWLVLGLLATRPESLAAYREPAGALVLAVGAAVSVFAYRAMIRIGRLPEEGRVLR
ncbi:MAG: type II secretion system protein F [Actinomycetales bacterium]|nr:type II secretion system protein F [Actinomycetales bacterium]